MTIEIFNTIASSWCLRIHSLEDDDTEKADAFQGVCVAIQFKNICHNLSTPQNPKEFS